MALKKQKAERAPRTKKEKKIKEKATIIEGSAEKTASWINRLSVELKRTNLTESQTKFSTAIVDNDVTFCYGPGGTSKTFTACYTALRLLIFGRIKRIVLVKPLHESGEKLGALPGTVEAKMEPYIESYRSNFLKMISKELLQLLETEGVIVYKPLAYMRGTTHDDCLQILDEAQNADYKALMLFITRMGAGSKCLLTGDVSQHDIDKKLVKLPDFIAMFKDIVGVGTHVFSADDIVRHRILIEMTKIYEKWKSDQKI